METTTLELANITTTYQPQTLKVSVTVQYWPFMSMSNYLGVILDNSGEINDCVNNNGDDGDLKWIMVTMGEVSLYLYHHSI